MQAFKYQAFMSYAHGDESMAAHLHRALETFPIPKMLQAKSGKTLSPIFRDVTELTAHHNLSEKIRDAVNHSRFLIVLCSFAAKDSHWVNEEIRLFRKLHGEASILCVLVEGDPDTSFPPALTENSREPLAANVAGGRENFRLGVTQLAASMLGVGLDELIRRDAKRRKRRTQAITFGAGVFSALMGGMAWTAMDARDDAIISRTEAEKMVEYMITDLKEDLGPVGKLNILDDVGKRVTDYYDAIPLSDMDDDRIARQARARHLLGQVALSERDRVKALIEIKAAYDATWEILRRRPDDTSAIFAHAQSEYWMGELKKQAKDYNTALIYWTEYDRLAKLLYDKDPNKLDWIMEAGWGDNNLAFLNNKRSEYSLARTNYSGAVGLFNQALAQTPDNQMIEHELANALAGQANAARHLGLIEETKKIRLKQIKIYKNRIKLEPNNYEYLFRLAQAKIASMDDFLEETTSDDILDIFDSLQTLVDADYRNFEWGGEYVRFITDVLESKNGLNAEGKKNLAASGLKYVQSTGPHQDFKTAHDIFNKFLEGQKNR